MTSTAGVRNSGVWRDAISYKSIFITLVMNDERTLNSVATFRQDI